MAEDSFVLAGVVFLVLYGVNFCAATYQTYLDHKFPKHPKRPPNSPVRAYHKGQMAMYPLLVISIVLLMIEPGGVVLFMSDFSFHVVFGMHLSLAFFFVYKLVATAIMAQNLTRGTTRLKYICLTTQVCLWIVNFACEGIQWVDHRLQLINSFCSGTACLFLAGVALYYSRVIVREVQTTRSAGAKRSGTGDKMKKFNRSVRLMMVMGFCSAVILYVFVYIRATGDTSYPARVEDFSVGAMVTQHGTMLSVNTVTNYVFWVRNSINEVQWASQSGKARLGGGSMLRPSEVMKSMDSRRRARSMNSRGRPNLSSTLRVSTIGVASASAIQIEESAKFVDVTFDAAEVRGRPRGAELIIDIDVDNADAEYGGATNSDLILPGAIH